MRPPSATSLLAFWFRAKIPAVRHAGLGLLLTATGKAAPFDLANAPQEWRVAGFIGLDLLMLGVAVVYIHKVPAHLAAPPAQEPRNQRTAPAARRPRDPLVVHHIRW